MPERTAMFVRILSALCITLALSACGTNPVTGKREIQFISEGQELQIGEQNKQTAARLGRGGEVGAERFAARVAPLMKVKPAYDKNDEAVAALRKKDYAQARSLAGEAARMFPKGGRFQQTLGEIALAEKKPQDAIGYYQKAITLDPEYFGSYLGGGVAQLRAGNKAKAQEWLERSSQLLPTAPAAYFLGTLARDKGDVQTAMKYYQAAASSDSEIGKEAAAEFVRLDLPQNPGNYVAVGGQLDAKGKIMAVVENRAPVPLNNIQITPVLLDAAGHVAQQGSPFRITRTLAPGERIAADPGVGQLTQEQLPLLRFRVDRAAAP
jgi:tetratricopeptide (TPR) repeat protein